jgi:hypothetical protein
MNLVAFTVYTQAKGGATLEIRNIGEFTMFADAPVSAIDRQFELFLTHFDETMTRTDGEFFLVKNMPRKDK